MHNPILSVQKLTLTTKTCSKLILDDISFDIHPQDFIILLGSNGSGKSSLIKTILHPSHKNSGNITFNNKSADSYSKKLYHKYIKTLSQDINQNIFENLSIYENFKIYNASLANFFKSSSTSKKEAQMYLANFNDKLAQNIDSKAKNLSGGEKQSLSLALKILTTPKILLLDEHTSALDPANSKKLLELTQRIIIEKKITCIMATHNLDDALTYGNRIIALKNGQVVFTANHQEKSKLTKEKLINLCYH